MRIRLGPAAVVQPQVKSPAASPMRADAAAGQTAIGAVIGAWCW